MNDFVSLKTAENTFDLPLVKGSENENAIDISNLRALTGLVTLDSGFKNTGATKSAITYLDGELGVLKYRGYPIEELAEAASFTEVAYLLIYGRLPKKNHLWNFDLKLIWEAELDKDMLQLFNNFPTYAHPMCQLGALVGSLAAFHPESKKVGQEEEERDQLIVSLMAKMPSIVSGVFRRREGLALANPYPGIDYVENFLGMTFRERYGNGPFDQVITGALNKLLILHADHEQNCSTSTVRMVGSSGAGLYAAVNAGIAALSGPLHGGANQAVIEMLEMIKADGGNCSKWIARAKDKNDNFRLMGFGHRVYKNFDPRAKIIKQSCDDVLQHLGINDPVLEIAKELEHTALNDSYFVEKQLYPNVDFYSGIIYRALGFPTEMFTTLFALGRLPGWIAQWKEMTDNKEPIGRPRQIYTGAVNLHYTASQSA